MCQLCHDRRQDLVERGAVSAHSRFLQLFQAVVQVFVPALDETVGVGDERRLGRHGNGDGFIWLTGRHPIGGPTLVVNTALRRGRAIKVGDGRRSPT